jgi:hypothetical protein
VSAPHLTADVRHGPLDECAVRAMRNDLNCLTVATLLAINAYEAMVGSGASMESGGLFCVAAFGRNLASVAVKISHLIYFIKKSYEICRDSVAVNCISVQRTQGVPLPSALTGHALG